MSPLFGWGERYQAGHVGDSDAEKPARASTVASSHAPPQKGRAAGVEDPRDRHRVFRVCPGAYRAIAGSRSLCLTGAPLIEQCFANVATFGASGWDCENGGTNRRGPKVEHVELVETLLDRDELFVHICLEGGKDLPSV